MSKLWELVSFYSLEPTYSRWSWWSLLVILLTMLAKIPRNERLTLAKLSFFPWRSSRYALNRVSIKFKKVQTYIKRYQRFLTSFLHPFCTRKISYERRLQVRYLDIERFLRYSQFLRKVQRSLSQASLHLREFKKAFQVRIDAFVQSSWRAVSRRWRDRWWKPEKPKWRAEKHELRGGFPARENWPDWERHREIFQLEWSISGKSDCFRS